MIYENIVREYFASIMNDYDLRYQSVAENSMMFVGKGYALNLTIYMGEVSLDFIAYIEGEYKKIDIWNYCVSNFTVKDREKLPIGTSVEDNIRCTLLVLARGLKNNFSNILSGDVTWIGDYKKYPLAGDIRKADKVLVELIES